MDVKSASAENVFQVYTAADQDAKTYILDVRPHKDFKKKHILQAFSIRLAANGRALLDYSKNEYHHPWSQDCWWDKHVLVYGDASNNKVSRSHPVVAFLAQDNHAKSLSIFKPGFEIFEVAFPFLCTASLKANAAKRFPAAIIPGLLYLGGWDAAEDVERLKELNIRRILTVHNHPDNLKPAADCKHLKFSLADVDTEDIAPLFAPSFDFIEGARKGSHGVLVHCGAGVSRSAAVCMAYLMRTRGFSAEQAREHCRSRRSVVQPNDGFWRALCAYERQLGIDAWSDPAAMSGVHGADATVQELPEAIARQGVSVSFQAAHSDAAGHGKANGAGTTVKRETSQRADDAARPSKRSRPDDVPSRRDSHAPGNRPVKRSEHQHWQSDSRDQDSRAGSKRSGRQATDADRDRDRDRGRDRASQDKDRHRDRRRSAPGRSRDRDRDPVAQGVRSSGAAPAAEEARTNGDAAPRADLTAAQGVVLEVKREGKVLGQVMVGMQEPGQRCVIGRDATPGACDLVLEHASISRRHAHLAAGMAGALSITDLGSAHGTNVDGLWLRPNAPRQLKPGSVLRFGGSTRTYEVKSMPPA